VSRFVADNKDMNIARAVIPLAALIIASSRCVSAQDSAKVEPPPGWVTESAAQTGVLALWVDRRVPNYHPNILVVHSLERDVTTQRKTTDEQLNNLKIVDAQREALSCADGAGIRYSLRMTVGANMSDAISDIIPDGAGGTYIVTYSRSPGTPVDDAAMNALKRVCTVSGKTNSAPLLASALPPLSCPTVHSVVDPVWLRTASAAPQPTAVQVRSAYHLFEQLQSGRIEADAFSEKRRPKPEDASAITGLHDALLPLGPILDLACAYSGRLDGHDIYGIRISLQRATFVEEITWDDAGKIDAWRFIGAQAKRE